MRIQHWQDVASLLLGAWLVLSPLAFWRRSRVDYGLEEWEEIGLGMALLVAPWSISYESAAATFSSAATAS
jgi:hypothetical protein